MSESDSRLDDFGGKQRPPMLHPDATVTMTVPGVGRRAVGRRGPVPAREEYGVVQYRTRSEHRIQTLDAHTMAASVRTRLRSYGCKCVLIAERDTGDVYEFHISQFDTELPTRYTPLPEAATHYFVECEHARAVYDDHAPSVLVDADTS